MHSSLSKARLLSLSLLLLASSAWGTQQINVPVVVNNMMDVTQSMTIGGDINGGNRSNGGLQVYGPAYFSNSIKVDGDVIADDVSYDNLHVTGFADIALTLGVGGVTTLGDDLIVTKTETIYGSIENGNGLYMIAGDTGNADFSGTLSVAKTTTLQADLYVSGTERIYGSLNIIGGNALIGAFTLPDATTNTTVDLLKITCPAGTNINDIAVVDVTYIATAGSNKEVFNAKYLCSDFATSAKAFLIDEQYFNQAGGMDVPASTGSGYAKAVLGATGYDGTANRITLRYLAPTKLNASATNVYVLYEIRAVGVGKNGFVASKP